MKVGITRLIMVAAIAALVVMAGVTPILAQSPNFSNFSPSPNPNLVVNGSTIQVGTNGAVLRLTPELVCNEGCVADTHVSGSAWFNTQQLVSKGFTTTFQFQITHTLEGLPADGLAFVIQNSDAGTAARGGSGGAVGYGSPDSQEDIDNGGTAIPNSLAIEFDTFHNSWDPDANHVAVQSCGIASNSQVHSDGEGSCTLGLKSLGEGISLTSGTHTATITYVPPCANCSTGTLDVILDNQDLFPSGGIAVNLSALLTLDSGTNAWVGFTGSTGADVENNDILSWTFTPQAQSASITAGGPAAVLNFNGGPDNGAYEYDAQLDQNDQNPSAVTVRVKPIPIDEEVCEQLVDANPKFGHAQCFVYKNADGLGHDSALLFELTCPGFTTDAACGNATQKFFATLGTVFTFDKAENEGFKLLASTIGPYPGWLKGDGGVAGSPCTPNPDNVTPLFQFNQITSFSVVGDPTGTTKGKSGGGGSCWVATYATGGELPPGIKITSPSFTTYNRNQSVTASYTCSNPKTSKDPLTSAVGPYLTVASCTQSQAPNPSNKTQTPGCIPGQVCTGGVDTSVKGLHVFQVRAVDSGGNVNVNVVVYNVK